MVQISKRVALRYLSHELRSPLNVVQNGINFVIQDLQDCSEDMSQYLDDIRQAAQAAVSVMDDYLNFEKIEAGSFPVFPVEVSFEDILSTMIKPLIVFCRQKYNFNKTIYRMC